MKNLKKVLALVIALSLALTVAVSASPYTDVADDASYAEAVTVLSSLGIFTGYEDGTFRPDGTITRAETAAMLVRFKGLESAAAGAKGATEFSDVAADHWASGYVNLASQGKDETRIINGMGDGTFAPSDPVTYEQVVKMIVAALGYTPRAVDNGGYPGGYLIVASQIGLTKGATGNNGQAASRGLVAKLLYNALEVDLMEQSAHNVYGYTVYQVAEGKNALNQYLDVTKVEGYITNSYIANGRVDEDDNSITITPLSGSAFSVEEGNTNASALLGQRVVAYYKVDDANNEDKDTLYAVAASAKNNEITLSYTDIEEVDGDVVKYYANESDSVMTELDCSDLNLVIYNGVKEAATTTVHTDWLADAASDSATSGAIRLIDNDDDDIYETAILTVATENYVVKTIDLATKMIETKDGGYADIDVDNENQRIAFYFADGTAAKYEDIAVGDVISIAENGNTKIVYISKTVVEGKATMYSPSTQKYTIGENAYASAVSITVGDEGKFYVNFEGIIVDKDTTLASTGNYAIAINAYVQPSIDGAEVTIKYIGEDGKWVVAALADKVTTFTADNATGEYVKEVNKISTMEVSDTLDYGLFELEKTGASAYAINGFAAGIFKLSLDANGDVDKMYFAGDAVRDDALFSADYTATDRIYSAKDMKLGAEYLTDGAIVFNVVAPTETGITVTKVSSLFKNGGEYTATLYDITEAGPAVIVVEGAAEVIDQASRVMLVTNVAETQDADGNEILKLYGYQDGKYVSGTTVVDTDLEVFDRNYNVSAADVAEGDTILIGLDANGNINKIQILMTVAEVEYNIDNEVAFFDEGDNNEDEYAADAFGYVAYKQNGRIKLAAAPEADGTGYTFVVDSNSDEAYFNCASSTAGTNFYNVNLARDTYGVSSFSKITSEYRYDKNISYVYIRVYDGVVVDVVSYTFYNEA